MNKRLSVVCLGALCFGAAACGTTAVLPTEVHIDSGVVSQDVDGGRGDGGFSIDAGLFDAGSSKDAGLFDAGSSKDAGLFDAGSSIDAGLFDAGSSKDAGLSDAGSTMDASVLDAGSTMDAGVMSDPTVLDPTTGLERQRVVLPQGAYSLADAQTYCANLGLDGHADWRVPTREELLSIVDYSRSSPRIDTTKFPTNTPRGSYWTSTAYAGPLFGQWVVDFVKGVPVRFSPNGAAYVRCVRGQTPQTTGMLFVNGDGTVTDTRTGLTWQQVLDANPFTAANVATYCARLALGGQPLGTWRVPTEGELLSIVDATKFDPAVDTMVFPDTPSTSFWSTTKESLSPIAMPLGVSFLDGSGVTLFPVPSTTAGVRCVR